MQEVVAAVVRERLPDVSIIKLLDGAIIFETECSYDKLNFFCFNNLFSVIDILNDNTSVQPGSTEPLELHMRKIIAANKTQNSKAVLSAIASAVISENTKKIKSFRLVCSVENKPASISETMKRDIENFITRNSSLRPNRSGADTEFWFLYRREGFSVFMKRLTHSAEKNLQPGELSPQLTWLLCRIGELKSGETVIDPFCGYGSIPEAALKYFPIKKFYALDADNHCIKIARQRRSLKNERCEILKGDAFSALGFIQDHSADVIITDPPWGMYKETKMPLEEFYEKTLALFLRLLKNDGRCVILTAARQELESGVEKTPGLRITQCFPILVSGKKAVVYKLVRK